MTDTPEHDVAHYDEQLREAADQDGGRGWAQRAQGYLRDGPANARTAVDRWFSGLNHGTPKGRS